jgi:hypothetical protein
MTSRTRAKPSFPERGGIGGQRSRPPRAFWPVGSPLSISRGLIRFHGRNVDLVMVRQGPVTPLPAPYSSRRARSARASRWSWDIHRLAAIASLVCRPCRYMPLRLPVGAPPRAPWNRQTVQPLTAGALQGWRVRFEVAEHRGLFWKG